MVKKMLPVTTFWCVALLLHDCGSTKTLPARASWNFLGCCLDGTANCHTQFVRTEMYCTCIKMSIVQIFMTSIIIGLACI